MRLEIHGYGRSLCDESVIRDCPFRIRDAGAIRTLVARRPPGTAQERSEIRQLAQTGAIGVQDVELEARDGARELMVTIFESLGDEHPLVLQYRPRLASALAFSAAALLSLTAQADEARYNQIALRADVSQEIAHDLEALQQQQSRIAMPDRVSADQMPAIDASHSSRVFSIVMVVHDMRREARRTLHSLSRQYQQGIEELDYEVIVVENGSSEPLGEEFVRSFGRNFYYLPLENAPKSPARAINAGAQRARGDVLAIMIDGAHILTPKILYYASRAFQIYPNPLVAPRYWFTGPGQQGETVRDGYGPEVEDKLFERINWPSDGYRLYEIGEFIGPNNSWLSGFFESNCLFMKRTVFEAMGGANERFDFPGGGFLNLDMMREASEQEGITLVTLLGEATFHQVHGGITTNVPPELREERVEMYRKQYLEIRGREYQVPERPIEYLGHRPDFEAERLAFKNK